MNLLTFLNSLEILCALESLQRNRYWPSAKQFCLSHDNVKRKFLRARLISTDEWSPEALLEKDLRAKNMVRLLCIFAFLSSGIPDSLKKIVRIMHSNASHLLQILVLLKHSGNARYCSSYTYILCRHQEKIVFYWVQAMLRHFLMRYQRHRFL